MKDLEHNRDFRVTSSNVDTGGRATPRYLLQLLEEMGWEHAGLLDLGFTELLERNLVWVLLRLKMAVTAYPQWGDTIRVKTWAAGKDKLFWYRDFMIYDHDGKELARATCTFVIIDLKNRRPHRSDDMFNVKIEPGERAFTEPPEKLPAVGTSPEGIARRVAYSDLDLNDHVNNVKYVEWMLDSYPLEFLKNHRIATLRLNYLNEARYGDALSIASEGGDGIHRHSIFRNRDGKELFRAALDWIQSPVT